jgi:arylsulfatase A-like enzyme
VNRSGTTPDTRERLGRGTVVQLAVWFATMTGLGQAGIWLIARDVIHRAVDFDPQVIWMATVSNLVVFCTLALLLAVASRRRGVHPVLAISLFAATAAITLFLMVPRLHVWALVLLAIGLGVQAARVVSTRLAGLKRMVRITVPALLGLVVGLSAAVNAWIFVREARAAATLQPVRGSPPNVLFLIWDTVRADHLGLQGYERNTTPFLEALSREAVVFDRAFANAPWTLASHGTFFTGHNAFELSANWTVPLDDAWPTLAEFLGSKGYATSAVVANYIFGAPRWGLARGFDHYRFWYHTPRAILSTSPLVRRVIRLASRFRGQPPGAPGRRDAANVVDTFLSWQASQTGRPFFAFLNLFDAHDPYSPGAPFDSVLTRVQAQGLGTADEPTPAMRQDLIDAYDAAIAWMDHETGRLVEQLRTRGVLDNTIVVIASDHGEMFGEYDLYGHGNSLYAGELHVPLIVRFPHAAHGGTRVESPVSLRELPATVTSTLGLSGTPFPGSTLVRYIDEPAGELTTEPEAIVSVVPFAPRQPESYPVSAGDMRSIVEWPDHYIVRGDGHEELFDLQADPSELNDQMPVADSLRLQRLRSAIRAVPATVTRPHR